MATVTHTLDFNALPYVMRFPDVVRGNALRIDAKLLLNDAAVPLDEATMTLAVMDSDRTLLADAGDVEKSEAEGGCFTVWFFADGTDREPTTMWWDVTAVWSEGDETFPDGMTKTLLRGQIEVINDVAHAVTEE